MVQVQVCDDPAVWDAYITSRTAHIYYQWRWRTVVERHFGHAHRYLIATADDGAVTGALPLVMLKSRLFGHSAVSLPFVSFGGVLADGPEHAAALLEACEYHAREARLSSVLLRAHSTLETAWPCQQHKVTMRLPLPAHPDDLWKAIGSKRRAQVKRPGKEGATTRSGGRELLDDFYRVFARNMRDLGTPVQSQRFFALILETFAAEAQLVVTYLGGQPVAAAFLLRHGSEMEIPWASSLREANRYGVNMLLYWEVLKLSIEQGAQSFDFGRSSKDASTLRFKKQWGAEPEQLYWYSWAPDGAIASAPSPDDGKFALAIRVWQHLPVPVANLLGPPIVKYLP